MVLVAVKLSLGHLHVLANKVEFLLLPILLPFDGEAVYPPTVPDDVRAQEVGR